jgi:hypothetical protein
MERAKVIQLKEILEQRETLERTDAELTESVETAMRLAGRMAIRYADFEPPDEPSAVIGGNVVPLDEAAARLLGLNAMKLATFPRKVGLEREGWDIPPEAA